MIYTQIRTQKRKGEWALHTHVWIDWPPHCLHKQPGRIAGYHDGMFGRWRGNEHYFIQSLAPSAKALGQHGISDVDEMGVAFIPEWAIGIVPPEWWK